MSSILGVDTNLRKPYYSLYRHFTLRNGVQSRSTCTRRPTKVCVFSHVCLNLLPLLLEWWRQEYYKYYRSLLSNRALSISKILASRALFRALSPPVHPQLIQTQRVSTFHTYTHTYTYTMAFFKRSNKNKVSKSTASTPVQSLRSPVQVSRASATIMTQEEALSKLLKTIMPNAATGPFIR